MLRRGAANDDSLCIEVSAHLFGTDTKRPRTPRGQEESVYALRDAFEIAVERAGILDFHLHDLRHTFASRLVMAGVDLRTVQELMGHKTIAMTLRYAHLSSDHKRKAIEALEQRFSEKSPINFHNTAVFAPLSEAKKAM